MATKSKNQRMRVKLYLMVATTCSVMAGVWVVLGTPETVLAKGKPVRVLGDAGFVVHGDFGSEIEMPSGPLVGKVAQSNYRTGFGTGNVVVTVERPEGGTAVLDRSPFLRRSDSGDVMGFAIGLKNGHAVKDRYNTEIPFPQTTHDPGDGTPWLEVVGGTVDADLNMLPGAHVILHLNVSGVPLTVMTGPNAGKVIGTFSIGDIEFTFPE